MVRVSGLAGVGLRVDCSGWVLVLALWALLPFVGLGVGLLAGLLLAGVWVSGMLKDLDAAGLLFVGVHFRGGLCFWGAGGSAFTQCEFCVQLLVGVLFAAFRPPLYGVLWCWGGGPVRGGSDLRAWVQQGGHRWALRLRQASRPRTGVGFARLLDGSWWVVCAWG
ncbi:hypothetical protein ILYODFUR_038904 [Ilyodon furcidens]|uniref:Uncharacterized protein n=1 Tax=Ilyodon furcidens TaxID=33524 RepID=A0ABV0VAB1_9TELE